MLIPNASKAPPSPHLTLVVNRQDVEYHELAMEHHLLGAPAGILRSTGQPNISVLYGGNERTHIQWF